MSPRTVLFEDHLWRNFLPLVYIRPACQLICGRGSLLQRLQQLTHQDRTSTGGLSLWCRPEIAGLLEEEFPLRVNRPSREPTLFLNGRGYWHQLPPPLEPPCVGTIDGTDEIACLWADPELAAALAPDVFLSAEKLAVATKGLRVTDVSGQVQLFEWPWELIHENERCLPAELDVMPHRIAGRVDAGSHVLAPDRVSIGAGSRIKPGVVIDAEQGPVWIGERVTIMPHCYVQGPAAIGDDSLLQPGAVVHAGTTIGPRCKVGGEIEASIIQGYSNKQHDGFLGHSYIGSWVNIAADCINSDLKNTYGSVRVPINGREVDTGEIFVGMLMGDYSKAGINVSFPTGAVVGFCSSVFRPMSPKFVPSFAWLDTEDECPFHIKRGVEIARKVMARRQKTMSGALEARFRDVVAEARGCEDAGGVFADAG